MGTAATSQQKAKPMPMGKEESDKMMEEYMKIIETSIAKMKEMPEQMDRLGMKVDLTKLKNLMKDFTAI